MTDVRTMYVYPLSEATRARLREVKTKMDVQYQIVPTQAYAGAGRTLAFEPVPWLVAEGIAEVKTDSNFDGIAAAIDWAVGDFEDKRALTITGQLERIFKKPIREVSDSEMKYAQISKHLDLANEKKVRFR